MKLAPCYAETARNSDAEAHPNAWEPANAMIAGGVRNDVGQNRRAGRDALKDNDGLHLRDLRW